MGRIICILIVLLGLSACNKEISTTSSSTNDNKVQLSVSDQEELNNRTILLNKICPTRQIIPECREWCKRVDCKE